MQYGYYAPNFDFCGDARVLADLAREAEAAGWDGFFLWDHLQFTEPAVDPWIALAAMALATQRIRLGTLVTPVPRRHVAKLAREVTSLDHLSGGRLSLGVGAGFPHLPDFGAFGDGTDLKERAERLDEALAVLARLWSGEPVSHHGQHYDVECAPFAPGVQRPHVPIWVAASWPNRRPLRRAARWDGVVPVGRAGLEVEPDEIAAIAEFLHRERAGRAFDLIRFGRTDGPADTATVAACITAGATWWMEYDYARASSLDAMRRRVAAGPPRIDAD